MTRKAILPTLLLMFLLVPVAQCFTIDTPNFNFQATHGGNVRFANAIVTTQIGIVNTIRQFNTFTIGGVNRGALAFDCDTGVNMTITGVTANRVHYTIESVGQVDSYVYYGNHLYEPTGTNTDNVGFSEATGITTVTTTGNVAVTLTYTVSAAEIKSLNTQIIAFYALFGIGIIAAAGFGAVNGTLDLKVVIGLLLAWGLGAIIVGVLITA